MSAVMVYITAKDRTEAETVGTALIESRLAACVNIIDPMYSMFHWDGAVQSEQETVLIAKTRINLVQELTARVKEVHSYDCPCVVALPVVDGNPDFIDWIRSETKEPG